MYNVRLSVRQSTVSQHMHTYNCTVNNMNMTLCNYYKHTVQLFSLLGNLVQFWWRCYIQCIKYLKHDHAVTIHIQWTMKTTQQIIIYVKPLWANIHMYHTEKSLVVNVFWWKCFLEMLAKDFLVNLMLKNHYKCCIIKLCQNSCWPPVLIIL